MTDKNDINQNGDEFLVSFENTIKRIFAENKQQMSHEEYMMFYTYDKHSNHSLFIYLFQFKIFLLIFIFIISIIALKRFSMRKNFFFFSSFVLNFSLFFILSLFQIYFYIKVIDFKL
jgi:hypothetical protein